MTKSPLPRWMHLSHGAYYYVRQNKWRPLGRDLTQALSEYGKLIVPEETSGVAHLVDRALDSMKLTIAPSTYKNYCTCSRKVKKAFANFTPRQIRPIHVAKFLDHNKAKPSMANLLRSFLKGVFALGVRWGDVEENPLRDIKPFKTKGRDRYITAEEFAQIHAKATPTLQCLMDLAYITGQRMGDVMGIRYADLSATGLYVKQQKTGAKVFIQMTPDLEAAIGRAKQIHQSVKGLTLLHRRDGRPLAYGTIHHQWVKACEEADVEDANFHDIRGATATDARALGQDSQTLLGHTTESSHRRYLRSKLVPVAQPVPARKT